MKLNQYIAKIVCLPSSGSSLTDDCSGAFFKEIRRAALLSIVLGITVVPATSCASTGNAVSARLISPIGDGSYQTTRSPGFDPDLFGG